MNKHFFNWNGFKTENELINKTFDDLKWETVGKYFEADPSGRPLNSPGAKADSGKLLPWLVLGSFSHALEEVSKVGTVGARKYTPNGWKTVEDAQARYMEAFGRHLLKYGKGEEIDGGPNGTQTHHIANMIWNLCAVLELKLSEKSTDKT